MHALAQQQSPLYDWIDVEWCEEFESNILEAYMLAGIKENQVCIDQHILDSMVALFVEIVHYRETGEMLPAEFMESESEWDKLWQLYSLASYKDEVSEFREDIKKFLLANHLAFDQRWAFAPSSEDTTNEFYNQPLQPVW